ncbi:hypothetical protein O9929_02895 [Vibrio lentus]|nr:hypothetical protein [Vibrio lentus]
MLPFQFRCVYLPALVAISCTSVLTTRVFGAKLATQLYNASVEKFFLRYFNVYMMMLLWYAPLVVLLGCLTLQ